MPVRTCCGCRKTFEKNELLHIARTSDGSAVPDKKAVLPGRGAYICGDPKCLKKAEKGHLIEKALKIPACAGLYELIRKETGKEDVR